DFDGEQLEGRLSLLTDRDGTLVDSWLGIMRLGSAGLTGSFRCATNCRLEAATLGHLVTDDAPSEALLLTGAQGALAGTLGVTGPQTGAAERKPMPDTAREYIIWPSDGQVITGGKFWIRMGLSGAGVAPAGVDVKNTGHHHLLIDVDLPPLDEPIPNDKNHLH